MSGRGFPIAIGAVVGLALGILVSVTTDLPLAPEIGLILGALLGWLSQRNARRKCPVVEGVYEVIDVVDE